MNQMHTPRSQIIVTTVPAGFRACLLRFMLSRNPFRDPPAPPAGPSLLAMLVVVNIVTWAVPTLYGLQALQKLGLGRTEVLSLFMRLGVQRDTPTHPSSRKRLAHLNQLR